MVCGLWYALHVVRGVCCVACVLWCIRGGVCYVWCVLCIMCCVFYTVVCVVGGLCCVVCGVQYLQWRVWCTCADVGCVLCGVWCMMLVCVGRRMVFGVGGVAHVVCCEVFVV